MKLGTQLGFFESDTPAKVEEDSPFVKTVNRIASAYGLETRDAANIVAKALIDKVCGWTPRSLASISVPIACPCSFRTYPHILTDELAIQRHRRPHDRLDWISEATEAMTKQHERWLELGTEHAAILLNQKSSYAAAIDALTFYYFRKALAMYGGEAAKAGRALEVSADIIRRNLKRANRAGLASLTSAAQLECERWATLLAVNGARYREALFVFNRSLFMTAIAQADGNHCKAVIMFNELVESLDAEEKQ
jgi:hypothetical protein